MSKDDVVPGLLELIQNQIDEELKNNPDIRHLLESIEDISKNFHNAYQFGLTSGQVVSNALVSTMTVENLPNGQMYFNIANRILKTVLQEQYERMADYTTQVQSALNQQSKLSIKAIKPQLNTSKIDGLVEILSREGDLENNIWAIKEPIINFSQTIVDDAIKTNAEFHYKAGLSPKIIRTSDGNCCDWCDGVVGEYKYPNVPKDVYRRHKNCGCEVNYYPGDGKVQNVHSKKWQDSKNNVKIEKRIKLSEKKDLIINDYQFGKKAGYHMKEFSLRESSKEDRLQFKEIIKNIYKNPDRIVRNITWRGQTSPVKAYIKGEDVVLVNKDEEFITILKGGINNARIKNK